jgi:hypothetical protein
MIETLLSWTTIYLPLVQFISAVVVPISLLVAVCALRASMISARQALRAHNYNTFQDLRIRIIGAWHDFTGESDDAKKALLFETVLNEYESACLLFNRGIVTPDVSTALDNFIVDGILMILSRDKLFEKMCMLRTRESTFSEIRHFVKRHRGAFKNDPRLNKLIS